MIEGEIEEARHQVLAENTAQAVHKHLSKLFEEEARFRSRWVWELLQNARDASPAEGIIIHLIQEPNRLVFKHNGIPFDREFPVSLFGNIKTDKLTSVLEYSNHRRTTDVTESTAHPGRSSTAI